MSGLPLFCQKERRVCLNIMPPRVCTMPPSGKLLYARKDQAVRALVKKGNEFLLAARAGFGLSENP